jgi:hypothetical protein
MSARRIFRGFFSYAHEDAEADPHLVEALTDVLEQRVNVRFIDDRFEIWRDRDELRTGDRWDPKILRELQASDILIVLLTPRWIGSKHCRNEYLTFKAVEYDRDVSNNVTGYIVPILARDVEKQKSNFSEEQKEIYAHITARQHQSALAADFRMLSEAERAALIDEIADDIEGMIERRRAFLATTRDSTSPSVYPVIEAREFDRKAHNFEEYDFIASAEVLVDKQRGDEPRGVYAQVDFTERLYVENENAHIEFGVHCAYWSFRNLGKGKLSPADDLRAKPGRRNAYYLTRLAEPEAIVLCIEPPSGKSGLAELALPPTGTENRLARIAIASADIEVAQLRSQLEVTLGSEGLWLDGEKSRTISQTSIQWIEAIMTVAAKRDLSVRHTGRLGRSIPIKERLR